jgi:hypothetical protein
LSIAGKDFEPRNGRTRERNCHERTQRTRKKSNLAFARLREFGTSRRLLVFNAQFPRVHPKKRLSGGVAKIEDFNEFKESEFLEICRGASIIGSNLYNILEEKLGRRNMAAQPHSTVIITQLQAEDFVSDLVNNEVRRLV